MFLLLHERAKYAYDMVEHRQKPVAFCNRCGAVSYSATVINGNCGRMVGGKKCKGVNASALNENDWTECPVCKGFGTNGGKSCEPCQGSGWVATRAF